MRLIHEPNDSTNTTITQPQVDNMITNMSTQYSFVSYQQQSQFAVSSPISNQIQNIQLSFNDTQHSCLYDFTIYQIPVSEQLLYLPVDASMIASIKLLKLMKDGHISSCHYVQFIKWCKETMLMFMDRHITSTRLLIKSKHKLIEQLHKLMITYITPDLSMKPIHNVISLPSTKTTKISIFDLKTSLFSLLTDSELMDYNNLLLSDQ